MTPVEMYEADIANLGYEHNPAQQVAVEALQRVYEDLVVGGQASDSDIEHRSSDAQSPYKRRSGWRKRLDTIIDRLGNRSSESSEIIKGLYLWGGVGRGKTYLMDLFYEALPLRRKMRSHFHRFMKTIHQELTELQGSIDPLERIADKIAAEAKVICFDEFFVTDITDAMILGALFEALFQRGVVLVATSNIPPDQLYKNGLQRSRFLPAIEAIQNHVEVLELSSSVDYRLRALERAEIYHYPLDEAAEENLASYYDSLVSEHVEDIFSVEIEGRNIDVRRAREDVVWADFDQFCAGPRSQRDYIELAQLYKTVLLSNVPQLTVADDDKARRFIYLVDEFYDRNVKLIISAAVPIESLYGGDRLSFEFQRTISRLLEMQSHDYLERPFKIDLAS